MVTMLAAGLALLCWPSGIARVCPAGVLFPEGPAAGRFAELPPAQVTGWAGGWAGGWVTGLAGASGVRGSRWVVGLIGVTATAIWAAGGPAVAIATALVLVTTAALTRAALRRRREQSDLAEMLVVVRALAREVRSGAQPLAAVRAVAAAHSGASARLLEQLATVVVADRGYGTTSSPSMIDQESEIGGRLAAGWALSARYGVPWVGLIDALATDLADRVRAASARAAQVSGPRVSGYVLAVMPALGLLLGAGMGADPVGVLLGTGAGHLMLLIGCALTCAGLWWTARIVSG